MSESIVRRADELTIEQLEKEKCELLGIIQGKDKAIQDLQKENAELREQVNILDNCDRLGDVITQAYKDKLAQAKEIISKLLTRLHERTCTGLNCEDCKQAEQFIKEIKEND